jgi:UDP-2-acetamido-2-deoxy-ribo-hexuluronate aminotransferase
MEFIDLKTQYQRYKEDIDLRIRKVLDHGKYVMGPEVEELEEVLADYVGVKRCITVSSGTHSLEIALRALDIGPGDEVITVPFSWISTAEVIMLVGATPVFADIDPETFNLDPSAFVKAITEKTRAVIPVSLFGQMPEMERLNSIAEKHNIAVIEDAAQSFGASRNGKRSCGAALIGSTSFFPEKTLGCYGDGGALFTDDEELGRRMSAIRTHGGEVRHHHTYVGTNGRFDTMQAAVILAKWPRFEEEVEARAVAGERYSRLLNDLVVTPGTAEGNTHVFGQYTIRTDSARRDNVVSAMREKGVPVHIYYPRCFHEQPVFKPLGYKWGDFPASEKASREVLSLPMHPFLTEEIQKRIADLLTELV